MKPWIRHTLWGAVALATLAAAGAAFGVWRGSAKLQRQVSVPAHDIALREDVRAVERGRYLYASRGCGDCHGDDGAGRMVIDDEHTGLRVRAPDIAPGPGSVVTGYRGADWERAVRHGVKRDGRPLFIMPAEEYSRWTDADLESLVAFVRQLPPVTGAAARIEIPPVVLALYGFGVVRDAAEKIDHSLPPATPVPETVSVEHGRYVAQGCIGCHGSHLSGGKIAGAPPDWPAAANLTPGDGGVLARYADAAAFKSMLRSGRRPDGTSVSQVMPFKALSQLNDVDADALLMYLRTLPPRPQGG